jgi:hypothetical protein
VKYVLAVVAKRRKILLHSACAMSNHWHVCLTDPTGSIVDFQRDCHTFIARALNAGYDDVEAVWESAPTSRVECEEPADLIGKIAYTMANPVEAALVRNGHRWPGLRRAWPSKPRTIRKPWFFFRGKDDGGKWPESAVLEFHRPPGYDELSDDELAAQVKGAIDQRESQFRAKYDAEKRPFLGRKGVLRQSRYGRPATREQRFGISPKVACRDTWRRIERLKANRHWLDDYSSALVRWRGGDRDVVFPAGTYLMRVLHGARCAAAPD